MFNNANIISIKKNNNNLISKISNLKVSNINNN